MAILIHFECTEENGLPRVFDPRNDMVVGSRWIYPAALDASPFGRVGDPPLHFYGVGVGAFDDPSTGLPTGYKRDVEVAIPYEKRYIYVLCSDIMNDFQ